MRFPAWLLKAFNHIQIIQQFLQGMVLEQILVAHRLVDVGKENQGNKLNEQLALEVLLR